MDRDLGGRALDADFFAKVDPQLVCRLPRLRKFDGFDDRSDTDIDFHEIIETDHCRSLLPVAAIEWLDRQLDRLVKAFGVDAPAIGMAARLVEAFDAAYCA